MNINDTYDIYNELVEIKTMMNSSILCEKTKNKFIQQRIDTHLVKLRAELDEFDQWCNEQAEIQYNGV
jgi:hypothetical protein